MLNISYFLLLLGMGCSFEKRHQSPWRVRSAETAADLSLGEAKSNHCFLLSWNVRLTHGRLGNASRKASSCESLLASIALRPSANSTQ